MKTVLSTDCMVELIGHRIISVEQLTDELISLGYRSRDIQQRITALYDSGKIYKSGGWIFPTH